MGASTHTDIVIVGASLAGLTAAEALREEGFSGAITVVGAEQHAPYSRPSLSKQVLKGIWSAEDAAFREHSELAALDIELLLGRTATGLDVAARRLALGSRHLDFEDAIIATGAVARTLPATAPRDGLFVLRTLDDALRLRAALGAARRVAIIGAGVLGCEIASAVRGAGLDAIMVGRSHELTFGRLGARLSERMAALLVQNGVELRLGSGIVSVLGDDRATGVLLADGTSIDADVVVVAIGSIPAVGWLRNAAIEVGDGIRCDDQGRAAPHVYAVGDVAAWRDPETGRHERVEHQQNAIEQAQAVARLLVHGSPSEPIAPFFWSEVFGTRILACGTVSPGSTMTTLSGSLDGDRFVLASARNGHVEGLAGWNMPREFRQARTSLHPGRARFTSPKPTSSRALAPAPAPALVLAGASSIRELDSR